MVEKKTIKPKTFYRLLKDSDKLSEKGYEYVLELVEKMPSVNSFYQILWRDAEKKGISISKENFDLFILNKKNISPQVFSEYILQGHTDIIEKKVKSDLSQGGNINLGLINYAIKMKNENKTKTSSTRKVVSLNERRKTLSEKREQVLNKLIEKKQEKKEGALRKIQATHTADILEKTKEEPLSSTVKKEKVNKQEDIPNTKKETIIVQEQTEKKTSFPIKSTPKKEKNTLEIEENTPEIEKTRRKIFFDRISKIEEKRRLEKVSSTQKKQEVFETKESKIVTFETIEPETVTFENNLEENKPIEQKTSETKEPETVTFENNLEENKPIEQKTSETKEPETVTFENNLEENKPIEQKTSETKEPETVTFKDNLEENKPIEQKPSETKEPETVTFETVTFKDNLEENKPIEQKPSETKEPETVTFENNLEENKPIEQKPSETKEPETVTFKDNLEENKPIEKENTITVEVSNIEKNPVKEEVIPHSTLQKELEEIYLMVSNLEQKLQEVEEKESKLVQQVEYLEVKNKKLLVKLEEKKEPLENTKNQIDLFVTEKLEKMAKQVESLINETESFHNSILKNILEEINKERKKTFKVPKKIRNTDVGIGSKIINQRSIIENLFHSLSDENITKKEESNTDKLVRSSIRERKELVTETLAKLYLQQKFYDKAVSAFEVLKVRHPEKIDYYNHQIEEIKSVKH